MEVEGEDQFYNNSEHVEVEYNGSLGHFSYNPDHFKVERLHGVEILRYVGELRDCRSIRIPEGIVSCYSMFANTRIEWSPCIPDGVVNCNSMFYGCEFLEAAPDLPKTVRKVNYMFAKCYRISMPPAFPEGVEEAKYAFKDCYRMEEPAYLKNSIAMNTEGIYYGCSELMHRFHTNNAMALNRVRESLDKWGELPIYKNGKVLYCGDLGCFYYDTDLFQVVFEDTKDAMKGREYLKYVGTHNDCRKIILPDGLLSCYKMFYECWWINTAPMIPKTVIDCESMYEGCCNLLDANIIPYGVQFVQRMYRNCFRLQRAPDLPRSVRTADGIFDGCQSIKYFPHSIHGRERELAPNTYSSSISYKVSWLGGSMFHCTGCMGDFSYDAKDFSIRVSDEGRPYLRYVGSCKIRCIVPNGLLYCDDMFSCLDIEEAPYIPDSVRSCDRMFYLCTSLKKPAYLPESVESTDQMYFGCIFTRGFGYPVDPVRDTKARVYEEKMAREYYESLNNVGSGSVQKVPL